jgi:hypothetical protein
LETVYGRDPEHGQALSEIYPPLNFVRAIKHRQPELLDAFRCLSRRRALVQDHRKLITVDDVPDELFDLENDPMERADLATRHSQDVLRLARSLTRAVELMERQRDNIAAGAALALGEDDDALLQRLRGLGYIE